MNTFGKSRLDHTFNAQQMYIFNAPTPSVVCLVKRKYRSTSRRCLHHTRTKIIQAGVDFYGALFRKFRKSERKKKVIFSAATPYKKRVLRYLKKNEKREPFCLFRNLSLSTVTAAVAAGKVVDESRQLLPRIATREEFLCRSSSS